MYFYFPLICTFKHINKNQLIHFTKKQWKLLLSPDIYKVQLVEKCFLLKQVFLCY